MERNLCGRSIRRSTTACGAERTGGIISVDEWNRQVAEIQELKEHAIVGKISDPDLKRQFDKV